MMNTHIGGGLRIGACLRQCLWTLVYVKFCGIYGWRLRVEQSNIDLRCASECYAVWSLKRQSVSVGGRPWLLAGRRRVRPYVRQVPPPPSPATGVHRALPYSTSRLIDELRLVCVYSLWDSGAATRHWPQRPATRTLTLAYTLPGRPTDQYSYRLRMLRTCR